MKITTPINQAFIVQLTIDEANVVFTALTHTRREYLGLADRQLISSIAHGIGSRLDRKLCIKPEVTP